MTSAIKEGVIAGLDRPAGPKPRRRGEGPATHRAKRMCKILMDPRVKPGGDERTTRRGP